MPDSRCTKILISSISRLQLAIRIWFITMYILNKRLIHNKIMAIKSNACLSSLSIVVDLILIQQLVRIVQENCCLIFIQKTLYSALFIGTSNYCADINFTYYRELCGQYVSKSIYLYLRSISTDSRSFLQYHWSNPYLVSLSFTRGR